MDDPDGNPAAAPEPPRLTPEPLPESASQLSRPSLPLSTLSRGCEGHFDGWETIGEQQDYYDVEDFLHLSPGLASEKLKDRKEDDVVIFDYSLDPGYLSRVDGNPPVGGGGPFPGHPGTDDVFFRVSKDKLIKSKQFDQTINPTKEPWMQARAPRLGIIDFPQCYDTSVGFRAA
ncbi:unnamed protein product [Tuber aestivum]|uniref:Uncharacterized protein n=1 Tax=Tuber aestivum TaxID=59557 RepID=A0A292Q1P6_9PEZI|nr:unnamed protein product [Tuber aestivum]